MHTCLSIFLNLVRLDGRCPSSGDLDASFPDFCVSAKRVKITMLGKPQQSAHFSGEDVAQICGAWPAADAVGAYSAVRPRAEGISVAAA